jgi:parallel beta-helix repeat protein
MRGMVVSAVILVIALAVVILPRGVAESVDQSISYTPHGQIVIYNDENFTAENGVVGGNGTYDNPYVISGWDIDISGLVPGGDVTTGAIQIGNTRAYLVIRDMKIHGDFEPVETNGTTGYTGNPAITIYFGANVRIENCVLFGTTDGIQLTGMANVVIKGNTITDNGHGIEIDNCFQVHIEDNVVTYSHFGNVLLGGISDSIVKNNTITNSLDWVGMNLYGSENCQVVNNTISDNPRVGLNIGFCSHCDILGNVITNNSWGIDIYGPEDVTLAENTFVENERDVVGIDSGGDGYFWTAIITSVVAIAAIALVSYLLVKKGKKNAPK